MCPFPKSLFSFVVKSLSLILILTIVWSRLKWIWQSQDTRLLWKWQIQINWSCWQTLWAICSESCIWQSHRLGQSTPPASLQKSVWERYCKLLYKKNDISSGIFYSVHFRKTQKQNLCPPSIYVAQKLLTPVLHIPFSPPKGSWVLLFDIAFS